LRSSPLKTRERKEIRENKGNEGIGYKRKFCLIEKKPPAPRRDLNRELHPQESFAGNFGRDWKSEVRGEAELSGNQKESTARGPSLLFAAYRRLVEEKKNTTLLRSSGRKARGNCHGKLFGGKKGLKVLTLIAQSRFSYSYDAFLTKEKPLIEGRKSS